MRKEIKMFENIVNLPEPYEPRSQREQEYFDYEENNDEKEK